MTDKKKKKSYDYHHPFLYFSWKFETTKYITILEGSFCGGCDATVSCIHRYHYNFSCQPIDFNYFNVLCEFKPLILKEIIY